jgi:hypothetical protein
MAPSLPFYHACLVVDDLERSLPSLTAAIGLTWTTIHVAPLCVQVGAEQIETTVRFAYSVQGPPYLEVLQRCPGTPWSQAGLHHLGLWSSDQHALSTRLDALMCPRRAVLLDNDGEWSGGLFHSLGDGLLVEFVDEATVKPRLDRWLGGGTF